VDSYCRGFRFSSSSSTRMIEYDEGKWAIAFIFQLRGSVIPKALIWAVPAALMSGLLRLLIDDETVAEYEDISANGNSLSFVLGFLIVFRTQKAYDRWWSAGAALNEVRADWFNAYSSLVAFGNQDPAKRETLEAWIHEIARYFSLLYGCALSQCSTSSELKLEFIDFSGVDTPHLRHLLATYDQCELVLQWIQRCIVEAAECELIKIAPPILSRVYNQLGAGIVKLTSARQIKAFPIPFLLAQMITTLMIIHWISSSVAYALSLQSVLAVMLVCFLGQMCFWGVHYIAVEMEGPYGGEANDLCLEDMQSDMNRSLLAIAHPLARNTPTFEHDYDKPLAMLSLDLNLELERMCADFDELPKSISRDPRCRNSGTRPFSGVVSRVAAELRWRGSETAEHLKEAAALNGRENGGAHSGRGPKSWMCVPPAESEPASDPSAGSGTTETVRQRAASSPPSRILGTYSM